MSIRETIDLELRVASPERSNRSRSVMEWIVIVTAVAYYWGAPGFWWWVAGLSAWPWACISSGARNQTVDQPWGG